MDTTQQPQNLTPSLTDTQIRQNIDALKSGGVSDDKIQAYVNNYQKGTNGNYSLKGAPVQPQDSTQQKSPTPGGFLGKVADFVGGGKMAQAAGSLLASGENDKNTEQAMSQSAAIESHLVSQIKADRAEGKDTTRLENALKQLQQDTQDTASGQAEIDTGGVTNKEVVGSALKIAATATGGYGFGAASKAGAASEGILEGALQGAKSGAVAGAVGGGLNGAGQGLENNEDTGGVIRSAATGAVEGGVAGGVIGGVTGGIQGAKVSKSQSNYVDKMLTPDMNAKASASAIKTGKVVEGAGLTGTRDFTDAIPGFDNIKSSVEQVPGVKKGNTMLQNVNAIHDAIGTTAQDLRSQLTNQEITPVVTQDKWKGYLAGIKNQIAENPLLVGDAEKTSSKILAKFQSMLPASGDITAENILDARQGLDKWIGSLKPNAFDPATENAVSVALRAVRQGANSLLAESAPDVAVRDLLSHQSNLYSAIDMIAPKAAKEAPSQLGRVVGLIKNHPVASALAAGAVGGGVLGGIVKKTTGL